MYMIIYINMHMYIYIHIYSERENKIVLMSPSEGTREGRKGKENVTE
jgi:hypothetical protein